MQAKKYLSAALAVGFAAVGVSANYMPDISHVLEAHSGVVFDGEADEFTPQAVVNRVTELKSIEGDEEAIIDRFYRDLEFGTGGLRGVIGAGSYRLNVC